MKQGDKTKQRVAKLKDYIETSERAFEQSQFYRSANNLRKLKIAGEIKK